MGTRAKWQTAFDSQTFWDPQFISYEYSTYNSGRYPYKIDVLFSITAGRPIGAEEPRLEPQFEVPEVLFSLKSFVQVMVAEIPEMDFKMREPLWQ